jgi:hypothetical protein
VRGWPAAAAEQVRAGSGTPQALDVSAIPFEGGGAFNLNGIVANGGRRLVVVDTNSGKLFRIDLGRDRASIRAIDEIDRATVPGGDGLLLDRGRLEGTQTSDKLRGPSTVDRAKGLYLVVNADFATSQKPFTVAGLPRRPKRGHSHLSGDPRPAHHLPRVEPV